MASQSQSQSPTQAQAQAQPESSPPQFKLGEQGDLPPRSTRSCTECSRRKTKCDHAIPCGACIKRGQAHACVAPTKRKRGLDPLRALDSARQAALSEVEILRNTLDSLRARLPNLEQFISSTSFVNGATGTGNGPGSLPKEENDDDDESGYPDLDESPGVGSDIPTRGGKDTVKRSREEESRRESLKKTKLKRSSDDSSEQGGPLVDMDVDDPIRRSKREGTDPDEGAAVEAAVDLEFMTLGRSRTFPTSNDRSVGGSSLTSDDPHPSILATCPPPPSPVAEYPNGMALALAAPSDDQADLIMRQAIDYFGWHHRTVHAPTFYAQVASFRAVAGRDFDRASVAWLSLYFAVLSVGTKLLGKKEMDRLNWTEEQTAIMGSRWFDCCISCLYRYNFLENHDLYCLQAISILTLSGRDAGSPSLIANLLSSGLSISQDLGLHRMPSDATFVSTVLSTLPPSRRPRALIEREMQKRVVYSFALTDWFSIPFRSSWVLGKVHITTPLPLNASDEDLSRGEVINRPDSEFTVVSWLLKYIDIGQQMQEAFEQSSTTSEAAYEAFRKVDASIAAIIETPPVWLSDKSSISDKTYFDYMRSTFLISVHHKLMSINRPFLYKPHRGSILEYSRRRVMSSARAILREAAEAPEGRIWTFFYHISAATFIVMLELFSRSRVEGAGAEADAMRKEIRNALPSLERVRIASTIAFKGLALVQPLLAQEQKQKEELARAAEQKRRRTASNSTLPDMSQLPATYGPPSTGGYLQSDPSTIGSTSIGFSPFGPLSNPSTGSSSPQLAPPAPTPFDYLGNGTFSTGLMNGAQNSAFPEQMSPTALPNWFYELGVENSENWLHHQLSGPGGMVPGGDIFDGWGILPESGNNGV
ncbi:hypothetical protein T439DRAFT_326582 [Meredithblackwellia eburnea MCA 4105]